MTPRSVLVRIVAPLALAETLIWAVTFYMFPAMLPAWESDFGWSKAQLSVAFTVALVLAALVAPVAGRLIDGDRGRVTMTASVLLAGVMLLALARTESPWQFYLAWAGIGIAMGGALYEACFAFVTRLLGDGARRAITTITLVAGFAGTVSFPLTYWLNEVAGWRATLVVYAAVTLLVIAPLILAVPSGSGDSSVAPAKRHGGVRDAISTPVFWLLAVGFALVALEHGIVITHLLPILDEQGLSRTSAVAAAAMIGPMQVMGRLGMIAIQRHLTILAIAMLSVACLAGAAASLWLTGLAAAFVVPFVVLHGAGNGVTSITRPVLTAECLGRANFGAISGVIAMMFMLMLALAPSMASWLWLVGGYDFVLSFVLLCCVVSLSCLYRVSRIMTRT